MLWEALFGTSNLEHLKHVLSHSSRVLLRQHCAAGLVFNAVYWACDHT